MKGAGHGHPRYRTNISSGGVRCYFYQRTIQDIIPVHNNHVVNTDTGTDDTCCKGTPSIEYRLAGISCNPGSDWAHG